MPSGLIMAHEASLDSILLPYQREWINDRAPVKVYEKSRRIGITWTESADAALNAARHGGCLLYTSPSPRD